MTDNQSRAATIKRLVADLNAALRDAADNNLRTDVEVTDVRQMEHGFPVPMFEVVTAEVI